MLIPFKAAVHSVYKETLTWKSKLFPKVRGLSTIMDYLILSHNTHNHTYTEAEYKRIHIYQNHTETCIWILIKINVALVCLFLFF